MPINTNTTFEDEEIRDTSEHTGSTVANGDFQMKTIIIENGLNQTVTCQCEGSMHSDFATSFEIGSSFDVTASTNQPQTCSYYYPYFRVKAQCGTAPTTGDLTIHVIGVKD